MPCKAELQVSLQKIQIELSMSNLSKPRLFRHIESCYSVGHLIRLRLVRSGERFGQLTLIITLLAVRSPIDMPATDVPKGAPERVLDETCILHVGYTQPLYGMQIALERAASRPARHQPVQDAPIRPHVHRHPKEGQIQV
jgi:hypothetical protein